MATLSSGCEVKDAVDGRTVQGERTKNLGGGLSSIVFVSHELARYVDHSWEQSGFDLTTQEWDPLTGNFERWHWGFPLEFKVQWITSRHGNELYVAGETQEGLKIIERWIFPPRLGEWFCERQASNTPLGTPTPLTQSSFAIHGGTYLPPEQREPFIDPIRDVVYLGDDFFGFGRVSVDPEGRFLLVFEVDSLALWQVDLISGAPPRLLGVPDDFPALNELECIGPMQKGTQNRIHVLGDMTLRGAPWMLLQDPDNDGLFDQLTTEDGWELMEEYFHQGWEAAY